MDNGGQNFKGGHVFATANHKGPYERETRSSSDDRVVCSLICTCMQTMNGAHWPHMEFPHVFNAIMEEWLAGMGWKGDVSWPQPGGRNARHAVTDEL